MLARTHAEPHISCCTELRRDRQGQAGMDKQGWTGRDGQAGMDKQGWTSKDGQARMDKQGWAAHVLVLKKICEHKPRRERTMGTVQYARAQAFNGHSAVHSCRTRERVCNGHSVARSTARAHLEKEAEKACAHSEPRVSIPCIARPPPRSSRQCSPFLSPSFPLQCMSSPTHRPPLPSPSPRPAGRKVG